MKRSDAMLMLGVTVIVAVFTALIVLLFPGVTSDERYERRTIDGVECLVDNHHTRYTPAIVSCDWRTP